MAKKLILPSRLKRPQPPREVLDAYRPVFQPAPELAEWLRAAFIEGDFITRNADHAHLTKAYIGCLWTNVSLSMGMRPVAATAEIPSCTGNAWKKGRFEQQMCGWFGCVPDFLITMYAPVVDAVDDIGFCAVSDHELYHCGQARDAFNCPKFRKSGEPVFGLRAHDVEEFVGVARRWGIRACAGDSAAFVRAAKEPPLFGEVDLKCVCGVCGR